jgi:hypothetical protein
MQAARVRTITSFTRAGTEISDQLARIRFDETEPAKVSLDPGKIVGVVGYESTGVLANRAGENHIVIEGGLNSVECETFLDGQSRKYAAALP